MQNPETLDHAHNAEVRLKLNGLEFFRQMMAGKLPPPPMVALLGMRLVEVDEGRVVFAAEPLEAFYNGATSQSLRRFAMRAAQRGW